LTEETNSQSFTATDTEAGVRLDAFLAEKIEGWSRSRLQRLIDDGDVLVNQKDSKPSYKLRAGDEIEVDLIELPTTRFEPENIPLDIVYEDESLAVINKPAGLVVHPGAGINSGTLANAVAYHFIEPQRRRDAESEPGAVATGFSSTEIREHDATGGDASSPPAGGGVDAALGGRGGGSRERASTQSSAEPIIQPQTSTTNRPGIVHRLDKDTSGLIVIAKNENIHEALATQFRTREVYKKYVALVHGSPRENTGKIERPIARDRWHRTKMTVAANGRSALTLWKVNQRYEKFTLLDVEIRTGRTHQIRVHLASVNHPVVGDATYNEGRDNTVADPRIKKAIQDLNRFFLHAETLAFNHPVKNERLIFQAPPPAELAGFLELLGE
jgi:23S rRNA pseudouridine1911/1915/1917 synthase